MFLPHLRAWGLRSFLWFSSVFFSFPWYQHSPNFQLLALDSKFLPEPVSLLARPDLYMFLQWVSHRIFLLMTSATCLLSPDVFCVGPCWEQPMPMLWSCCGCVGPRFGSLADFTVFKIAWSFPPPLPVVHSPHLFLPILHHSPPFHHAKQLTKPRTKNVDVRTPPFAWYRHLHTDTTNLPQIQMCVCVGVYQVWCLLQIYRR